ncbi:MAG: MFS transporter [Candidatus Gastranaerophilales bacterium]|nr:MFS transporter [Candidatus Gastranaerophilales bacterium]
MENIKRKFGPLANIDFARLFAAQLFSHFSDATVQFILVAILLGISDKAGQSIAITFFTFMLPQFLTGLFSGVICDRFSRKSILYISCLYRVCVIVLLILNFNNLTPFLIYCFSFLLGTGAAFFYPAKMSAITNIVEGSQLKFANAMTSAVGAVALLFGALTADRLMLLGAYKALGVIAVMYFAGFVLTSLINFRFPQKFIASQNNDVQLAINYIKRHKKALSIVVVSVILHFVVAIFSNTLNSLITDYFGLPFSDLTYLRTMLGIGIIAGMIITIYFARMMRVPNLFATGFMVLCLALVTAPLCKRVMYAWIWLLPIGAANAVVSVMLDTMLQKVSPDRVRGKIFGLLLTLNTLSLITGTLFVATTTNVLNPFFVFKIMALITFVLALLILLVDKPFRYFLLKATLGQIFLMFFKYKVEGAENIPLKSKVILAGNHTGHLDPFIIQMATNRPLWFVTGPAAFQTPIVKYLLKFYNVLPLKFGHGMDALEAAIQKLKGGEAVIIFPEGKFTPDGNLCKFNRGVGIMAREANCPIVPFAIKGGFETWGQTRRLPKLFNTIVIQFGQPITEICEDEKETVKELKTRVNFMKQSLERRSRYGINQKHCENFLDLMQEKGDTYGQTKALSLKTKNGYEALTYLDISRCAKKFANYLIDTVKIERGDRIAILSESRPEFSVGMFASIQTGAITVPLDVKLTVSEHSNILNDCNPRLFFCSSHYAEHAKQVKEQVPSIEQIFVLDDETEVSDLQKVSDLNADINQDIGRPRSLNETALIVYTSGTTGNPKGVMISFGNIYSQLKDFEQIFKLSSDNTLLSILPLNHLLELNVGFFGMLYMGAKVVYMKSLSPKELTNTMKEKQITNMIVVPLVAKMLKNSIEKQINKQPKTLQMLFNFMFKLAKVMPRAIRRTMFKNLIDELGGKLECFISGGAPLEDNVAEFFNRIGIPVFQGYGLTETSPTISTNTYQHNKIGTVGKPLPSVRVKIAENGEILAAGSNVMQGYYNKPEMTAEVIDEDGWFHTGDIGEIDRSGYIKITGRIKNMIVLGGGKKIFPEEVEAVMENSPNIKELCVMSLKIKSGNKAGTEEVGMIFVPSDTLSSKSDDEITKTVEADVKTLGEKYLAPYKIPTQIVLHREELPKTSTKKVKRKVLLEWYENL